MLYLLSNNYYNSIACLNEMGAAWVKQNRYSPYPPPRSKYVVTGNIPMNILGQGISHREYFLLLPKSPRCWIFIRPTWKIRCMIPKMQRIILRLPLKFRLGQELTHTANNSKYSAQAPPTVSTISKRYPTLQNHSKDRPDVAEPILKEKHRST